MEPGLRIDLSICTAGGTVERIGQTLQGESLFRRLMGDNVRWASQRWRTKSFNRRWGSASLALFPPQAATRNEIRTRAGKSTGCPSRVAGLKWICFAAWTAA